MLLDALAILLALTAIGRAWWEGGNLVATVIAGAALGVTAANWYLRWKRRRPAG